MKQCSTCKQTKENEEFTNWKYSVDGKFYKCKVCKKAYEKERSLKNPKVKSNRNKKSYSKHKDTYLNYYIKNKDKIDQYSKSRLLNIEKFLQRLLSESKRRASRLNLDFDLDKEFLIELYNKQNKKCAVTGIDFDLEDNYGFRIRPYALSIDRMDSKLGYTKTNVRLTCISVNLALNQFGDKVFDNICKSYVNKISSHEK